MTLFYDKIKLSMTVTLLGAQKLLSASKCLQKNKNRITNETSKENVSTKNGTMMYINWRDSRWTNTYWDINGNTKTLENVKA